VIVRKMKKVDWMEGPLSSAEQNAFEGRRLRRLTRATLSGAGFL